MKQQPMKKSQIAELIVFIMLFALTLTGQLSLPEHTNLRGVLAQINVLIITAAAILNGSLASQLNTPISVKIKDPRFKTM